MRTPLAFLVIAALATSATAQVQVVVTSEGRKLISNFGGVSSGRSSDLRWLAKQRNRRSPFDAIIDRHAVAYGVDPVLVRAVIQVESNFDPRCVSNKGARGLMQLMPETAKRYGVRSMFDPEENIRGGVRYLGDLLTMFHNDLPRALAAYNAGENAVLKYAGIPPYTETNTYVKRALTVYYGSPYGQATSFAGASHAKLKGGFMAKVVDPLAAAVMPGMRYLGSN
jgi:soluble lytic murein transglycosylase-like protein